MSEQWGPWIEHDGKHAPRGMFVNAVYKDGDEAMGICGAMGGDKSKFGAEILGCQGEGVGSWFWTEGFCQVIRYRIRKPKGLTLLEEIAKNPERELEEV